MIISNYIGKVIQVCFIEIKLVSHIHTNSYLAITSTVIFYYFRLHMLENLKRKYIFLSPFIVSYNVIYIFVYSFYKSTGDMFKNYYYSFFNLKLCIYSS